MDSLVATAVARACAAFARGDPTTAEAHLGQQPVEAIFRQDPLRAGATRQRVWLVRLGAVVPFMFAVLNFNQGPPGTRQFNRVNLSAPVVRRTLNAIAEGLGPGEPGGHDQSVVRQSCQDELLHALKLPSRELLSPVALRHVDQFMLTRLRHPLFGQGRQVNPNYSALYDSFFQRAVVSGLVSLQDLQAFGVSRAGLRRVIRSLSAEQRSELNGLVAPVLGQNDVSLDVDTLAWRLRFLNKVGCLDLMKWARQVRVLCAHQVRSRPARNHEGPKLGKADRAALRGLFFLWNGDVLKDTWSALTVLRLTHALNRIDREACIAGILRLDRGRGFFRFEPSPATTSRVHVPGNAEDTYCAFACLRMLGALDRVKDLGTWEFRVQKFTPAPPPPPWTVAEWEEVEAWLLRRALRLAEPVGGARTGRSPR